MGNIFDDITIVLFVALVAYITTSTIRLYRPTAKDRILEDARAITSDLIANLNQDNDRLRSDNVRLSRELQDCLGRERSVSKTQRVDNVEKILARMMDQRLDQTAVKTAAFDYGVDWFNLKGENKQEKIIDLIDRAIRNKDLKKLINIVSGLAPNFDWPKT